MSVIDPGRSQWQPCPSSGSQEALAGLGWVYMVHVYLSRMFVVLVDTKRPAPHCPEVSHIPRVCSGFGASIAFLAIVILLISGRFRSLLFLALLLIALLLLALLLIALLLLALLLPL